MKYLEYIEFILNKVPLVKIMTKFIRIKKSKLLGKNAKIDTLLDKVNQKEFRVGSFVKIEGILLPFAYLGEPETFSPTKIVIDEPDSFLKENRYKEKKFTYQPSEIPIKEITMEDECPFKIAFLFSKDCNFKFNHSGTPGDYHLETNNNKFMPVLLSKEDYERYVGKTIILYSQISKLDTKLKKILVNTKVGILEDLQSAFYSPYKEYVKGIYALFCAAKPLRDEISMNRYMANCIEFEVIEDKSEDEIYSEVEKWMTGYLKNKYRILSFKDKWVTHVLFPGKIFIHLKRNYVGFYVELDMNKQEENEFLQKELVRAAAFFKGNTKLKLKESFYSKNSHIDVVNNNGKW